MTDLTHTICVEEIDERIMALANHLDITIDEIEEEYGGNNFTTTIDGDFMVLTDDEAEKAWDESLDSYLEECIYPTLPEPLCHYFDEVAWKRDARIDGRGHSLNYYDGTEYEEKINNTWFFIYRTN